MKVKLTYFKPSGKFYSAGEYDTEPKALYEIWDDIRQMKELPGLVAGPDSFIVSVDVPEHEHNHPCLLIPGLVRPAYKRLEPLGAIVHDHRLRTEELPDPPPDPKVIGSYDSQPPYQSGVGDWEFDSSMGREWIPRLKRISDHDG